MLTWSIAVVSAVVLGGAGADAQKSCPRGLPAPGASRLITQSGAIRQTSYFAEFSADPCAPGCASPTVPSCAMPMAPSCCQPMPSCSQPFMPSCSQPFMPSCAEPVISGCDQPMPGCATPVDYGCAQPMYSGCGQCCQNNCCQQSCCDRCCNKLQWERTHTTGDMYPHYPYYPQDHGYYYFRPYNYMNVYNHMGQVTALGGDPRNPYSVAMFDPIYEDFYQQYPRVIEPPAGSVRPLGSNLPNLEDLLKQQP